MKSVSSLWYGRELREMELYCIKSYINRGYIFKLYIYDSYLYKNSLPSDIVVADAGDILPYSEVYLHDNSICPFADYWRYNMMYKTGETWTDMDMLMINDLPDDDIIISSEYMNKTGAFKCVDDYRPNIGLLRFPVGDPFLKHLIEKCRISKVNHNISNMIIFRKLLKKYDYEKYVSKPSAYCPVGWQFATHLYKTPYHKLSSKFGVDKPNLFEILENSYCVHLWNNIHNNKSIDSTQYVDNCLYSTLLLAKGLKQNEVLK
tara:strand:- start:285 stop:1067 length:783 start_codon:yes stop_codon:yes gene_type:complete